MSNAIEQRLSYLSLEALEVEQLQAIREQREHFRAIGMELVAELGRPLREDIPAAISSSISTAMAPLLDQVGKAGTEGVGHMVDDLASRFSDDVGRALSQASERLSEAGDRLAQLSDRLEQSSGRMGGQLDTAVEHVAKSIEDLRSVMSETAASTGGAFSAGAETLLSSMNETLDKIRLNTDDSAKAMSAAAADLQRAGTAFSTQIEEAATSGSQAARERILVTSEEISGLTRDLTSAASKQLLSPIEAIAEQMKIVAQQLSGSTSDLRLFSDGIKSGAEASSSAADTFRVASGELSNAAAPIRSTVERMEQAMRSLTQSTQNISDVVGQTAETIARNTADAMDAAKEILASEARAIDAGLAGVTNLVDRMSGQGDQLDDIDEKLGRAFEIYTSQVASAVDSMREHVAKVQGELTPALDTLKAIVDQAEQFAPQSRQH